MSKEIRTSVRLPENIHKAVVELSKKERRSFNAQLSAMVEEYLRTRNISIPPTDA